MRIKSVTIKNFRSIRELVIHLDRHNCLIGANGAGKSTVLHALQLFYAPGIPTISSEDYFNRVTEDDIEIALAFEEFTAADRENFGDRITAQNVMSVSRIFSAEGGRTNGRYYGVALRHSGFDEIRSQEGARDKTSAYNALRGQTPYADLPAARSAGAVDSALAAWEQAHPDRCELGRDDGQFFGFTNVANGKLQNATRFVYVPAVRDASNDAKEARGSAITQLLDLVVRSAISAKPELREFQENIQQRYRELTDPANLAELGGLADRLTGTLRTFYEQCAVQLNWQEASPLAIPLPAADMRLVDSGYDTTVDRTGHGLQRALILTLLQHLAVTTSLVPASPEGEAPETPRIVSGLMLAIEEPELYQHPTKQRHFAKVLRKLSMGEIPGVTEQTQILVTTHSPLFVSMDDFEGIRIMRRIPGGDGAPMQAQSTTAKLADVATALATALGRRPEDFTADTLKPRLHIMERGLNEGFFASAVVLVEGPSDKAALIAAAILEGKDFEASEISVIATDGKSCIDKPLSIFQHLGIPVYPIWDNDLGKANPEINRELQHLCKVSPANIQDAPERVEPGYACFADKLETTLKKEIGEELFNTLVDRHSHEYGLSARDDAQKTPAVMIKVLRSAADDGHKSATLRSIVEAVFKIQDGAIGRTPARG